MLPAAPLFRTELTEKDKATEVAEGAFPPCVHPLADEPQEQRQQGVGFVHPIAPLEDALGDALGEARRQRLPGPDLHKPSSGMSGYFTPVDMFDPRKYTTN